MTPRAPRIAHLRRRAAAGFSLMEVLAATTIFSIAIVSLVQNIGQSTAIQGELIFQHEASFIAQNIMEEMIIAQDWIEGEQSGEYGEEGFAWTTIVADAGLESRNLWEVTVIVNWGGAGVNYEYKQTSLFGEIIPLEAEEDPPQ